MDSTAQPERYPISSLPVLAVALMFSATTHAASNGVLPCEQVERDLQSLEVSVESLSADSIESVGIDPEIIDEQPAVSESAAPILKLGPRVTSIMREVFAMTDEEPAQETSQQPSSSPLADSDLKEEVDPDEAANETDKLPRFQRRMLRTDI